MKKTTFVLALFFLLTNLSQAKDKTQKLIIGGVDVGNGFTVNSGFELKEVFLSEQAVLSHFDSLKGSIHSGENPRVKGLIRRGRCSKGKVKLNKLHFNSYYPSANNKLLKKRYKGVVSIGLFNCKRPDGLAINEKLLPGIPK